MLFGSLGDVGERQRLKIQDFRCSREVALSILVLVLFSFSRFPRFGTGNFFLARSLSWGKRAKEMSTVNLDGGTVGGH